MATAIGFDPATVNQTTAAPWTLGQIVERLDTTTGLYRLYKFVQVKTAACADGTVMCRYNAAGLVIGANRATALAGTPIASIWAGVGIGAISINNFGFVMIHGIHTNVLSGTSTLGRWQMPIATNDTCGDATASLAYTDSVFGQCLVATSGGRATIDIRGL